MKTCICLLKSLQYKTIGHAHLFDITIFIGGTDEHELTILLLTCVSLQQV